MERCVGIHKEMQRQAEQLVHLANSAPNRRSKVMIFIELRNILGQLISLDVDGLSWTILKPPKVGRLRNGSLPESGGPIRVHRRKLKFVVEVLHECFEPVNDPGSGTDIVQDVIFNKRSDLNRLNFSGFYTLLLEREDEIITVVAVRYACSIIVYFSNKLLELGVERLVSRAAGEVLKTWTGSFGFSEMTEAERLMFLEHTFHDQSNCG
ncbi:hypothetical protein Syun_017773 [Stephania yunnanensis]|uniref:Increased DNA methylation 1 C-terminal domain-containing protein n=1 Tax=Stephania yunnanensis TaxID=152371 RepID=A0AAP0J7M9_9MAGN